MTRIYKYKLGIDGELVEIKARIRNILTVQIQDGWPHIWCLIDDEYPEMILQIVPLGTGWEVDSEFMDKYDYIGTVQDRAGFVWHYYAKYFGLMTDIDGTIKRYAMTEAATE